MSTKDSPLSIGGTSENTSEDSFFRLRKNLANGLFDTTGLWSYPALIGGENSPVERLHIVAITVPLPHKKQTALFRPKELIVTRAGGRAVVRFEDFRAGNDPFPQLSWKKPIALFPHQSIATLTYEQFASRERDLLAQYPEIEEKFAADGSLTPEFSKSFLDLIHPVFLPFLRKLAPRFVAALSGPGGQGLQN